MLGALQSDDPRPYYWAAALYALPLLRNGLDLDWFSWTLLLLGVVHVQVGKLHVLGAALGIQGSHAGVMRFSCLLVLLLHVYCTWATVIFRQFVCCSPCGRKVSSTLLIVEHQTTLKPAALVTCSSVTRATERTAHQPCSDSQHIKLHTLFPVSAASGAAHCCHRAGAASQAAAAAAAALSDSVSSKCSR